MEERTFGWPATARGLTETLVGHFNQGHFTAHARKSDDEYFVIQIETREFDRGGRERSALTISVVQRDEFVKVTVGDLNAAGAAGDLLEVGVRGLHNPLTLLGKLSSLSDDLETLQLPKAVWEAVEQYAANAPEPQGPKDIIVCKYCNTGVKVGILTCPACAASLADQQPSE